MKPTANTFRNLATVLLPMAVVGLSPLEAAPPALSADTNAPPQSVFVMPASPRDGRDPFFPNSIRPYQEQIKKQPGAPPEVSSLKLQGISQARGHYFATINDETFAEGDESDVKTPTGKIHVRCDQIKTGSVVIEAGGQILTLTLSNP